MKLTTMNIIIHKIMVMTLTTVIIEAFPEYMVMIQIMKPNLTPVSAGILLSDKLVVSTAAVKAIVVADGRVAAGCRDMADLGCASARRIESIFAHPNGPKVVKDGYVIDDNIGVIICKKPFQSSFYPIPYQSQASIQETKCHVTHTATSEVAFAAIVCFQTGDPLEKNKGLLIGIWYRFLQKDTETFALKLYPYRTWIQKNSDAQFKQTDLLLIMSILLSIISLYANV